MLACYITHTIHSVYTHNNVSTHMSVVCVCEYVCPSVCLVPLSTYLSLESTTERLRRAESSSAVTDPSFSTCKQQQRVI